MLEVLDGKLQVALVAVAVAALYFVYKSQQKKFNLPPGPTPLPILGNLLTVGSENFMFIHLMELGKKYGDIFKIQMGRKCIVILNDVEVVREAYLKRGVEFANRPDIYTAELVGRYTISLGQYTPAWKIQRKIAHDAFKKFARDEPLELMLHTNFGKLCKDIDSEGDTPFDPYPKLTRMIYDDTKEMVFGKRFGNDDPVFKKLSANVDRINEQFGNGLLADIFPIFKYFPSPTVTLIKSTMDDMIKFMRKTWREHLRTFKPDELTDFVYQVIAAKQEAENDEGLEAMSELTEEHYLYLLSDMFFNGADTSRITLAWVIGLCAAHPEVQTRMHAEIDDNVGRYRSVCISDRPHLPYTEAVLHEAMRLYPVTPLAAPRSTTCDTVIKGYDIPEDTWVMPNIWKLHRDPKEWSQPEKFMPERHLAEDGTLAPKPSSFMPFSIGRRVCVGEEVAKVSLHMLTAMLFQRYAFLPPPGGEVKLEMIPSFICLPKAYKVIAKARH